MEIKTDPARISFAIGCAVFVIGWLMFCSGAWLFALAAFVFGITAAIAKKPILRWLSVILIALSSAAAIQEASFKERVLLTAEQAGKKSAELNKLRVGD
jgi:hypothetical protein